MKKRNFPLHPLKSKKQREKKLAGLLRSTVYRGRAGARCADARRGVAAVVATAVEDALSAFGGTRGPKPSDETLWAAIAWRIGGENFAHAVIEKIAENNADGWPRKPAAAFQRFLDKRFPKRPVDAESSPRQDEDRSIRIRRGETPRPRGRWEMRDKVEKRGGGGQWWLGLEKVERRGGGGQW